MSPFTDLGVPEDLIDALESKGIDAPFPIQAQTIPPALGGRDVSGRAPTGSGKTLAFGIPLVANVERARPKRPRALVLVPTRELAAQVARDLEWLGARRDVRVHAFYGGARFEPQVKALRRGVDIAVACPGRLADLINQGIIRLDGVDLVVVDEADRMADMGFLPEVKRLVVQTSDDRQMLLFSATLDGDVDALVKRYQHDPIVIDVTPEQPTSRLDHHFWTVPHAQRVETTAAIIQRLGPTVVFTRTRHGADRLANQLARAGVEAAAIHGNRTQNQRERALQAFRTGHAQALVATDVAARGIHVDHVTCVVHFDLPTDPKDYIHRSGRTGRAGETGTVIALAMPDRRKDTKKLLRELDLGISVTDPDVDGLPKGQPITPAPLARTNGRARRNQAGRGPGRSPSHKPSGKKPRNVADSPGTTRAARTKHGGTWHDRDNHHEDNDRRPGDNRGPKRAHSPKPEHPADKQRNDHARRDSDSRSRPDNPSTRRANNDKARKRHDDGERFTDAWGEVRPSKPKARKKSKGRPSTKDIGKRRKPSAERDRATNPSGHRTRSTSPSPQTRGASPSRKSHSTDPKNDGRRPKGGQNGGKPNANRNAKPKSGNRHRGQQGRRP